MIRQRLRRGGIALLVLVFVAAAAFSQGYPVAQVDSADRGLWVANASRQAIGRVNTAIDRLDTAVPTATGNIELVQAGAEVLLVDRADGTVSVVDPAHADLRSTVDLPTGAPTVLSDGTVIVIHVPTTGATWIEPLRSLEGFDAESEPTLDFGAGSVVSLDPGGRLVAYSPGAERISVLDAHASRPVPSSSAVAVQPDAAVTVTSVGGTWALLDARERSLRLPDRKVDLARFLAPGSGAQLQSAGADGTSVFIASTGGLIEVPLRSGDPRAVLSLPQPAASTVSPLVTGDCGYAAWSDGTLWRRCLGADAVTTTLSGLSGRNGLRLRSDASAVVLNDDATGTVWTVSGREIGAADWAALLDIDAAPASATEQSAAGYDVQKDPQPPSAADDDLGARPGRATVLPVLLNDSDPNGDALVVSAVGEPSQGTMAVVAGGQQLQLALPDDAVGVMRVPYTIDDGRGGSASAIVTVTVRGDDENAPPVQARASTMDVALGGRGRQNVLSDWLDPDGDPFYVAGASGEGTDAVGFEPSGAVSFADGTGRTGATVGLLVSDGRANGAGTLTVAVHPSAEVPMHADAFAVRTVTGQEITVSPLPHVKGIGAAPVLSAVTSVQGSVIAVDPVGGTFRFRSATVGTASVEYTVSDGGRSTRGYVRVDVVPDPSVPEPPITVAHTAFVRGEAGTDLDVLAQDVDPAGGVLIVTGVQDVPADSGLQVQVIDDAILRIRVSRLPAGEPLGFRYTVSNGSAQSLGDVTIVAVDQNASAPAPVGTDDSAAVRVDSVVDIPVLDNDIAGDGGALRLDPALARDVPAGAGLLFVEGDRLRFLAPDTPGTVTASYRVVGEDGQWSTAELSIAVREADAAANTAPVPETVTARVFSGQSVRIPIPLGRIDPDGDTVRLLGQQSSPKLGIVTAVDAGEISYRAGDEANGTDSFQYTVVDGLGARSTGTVRIGIAPAPDGYRQPVAVNDAVAARPGSAVTVEVLRNDLDPDGSGLAVTSVESVDGRARADVDGERIRIDEIAETGRYGFIYSVSDRHGGSSTAFLTVEVAVDAPLSRPEVADRSIGLSDVVGRSSVDVPVLDGLTFADGDAGDVVLAVVPGFAAGARVVDGRSLRIAVRDAAQVVPFSVARADDPTIVAHAFAFVAGARDSLPQLRSDAPALTVPSGAELTVALADMVVAAAGRTARIADPNTVIATHSDGAAFVDARTVRFRSADDYVGPASLSFDVTDDAADPPSADRTTTIVLPVAVTATGREAPRFIGTSIELEPGGTRTVDLGRLTAPTDQLRADQLDFAVAGPAAVGLVAAVSGRSLQLSVPDGVAAGTTTSVLITVTDRDGRGTTGRVDVRVVGSTRPLAVAPTERVVVPRGSTAQVNVLADAQATNPFPGTPLRLVEVSGLEADRLPTGIEATVGDDGSLTVGAQAQAAAGSTPVRYRLLDATGDPARSVWGRIEIVVQDRPDPVDGVVVRDAGDRTITVAWTPGADNFAAITGYRVLATAGDGHVVSDTRCAATECTIATGGNGPDNAVRLAVTAINAVGESSAAGPTDVVWSDILPDAPTELSAAALDSGFRLTWSAPPVVAGASAVTSYVVTVAGAQIVVPATSARISRDFVGPEYPNGVPVDITVSARNAAVPYLRAWNSATVAVTPYAPPVAGAVSADADPEAGEVSVTWAAFDPRGDPLLGYVVQRITGDRIPSGAQACAVTAPAPGQLVLPSVGGKVAEQAIVRPDGALTRSFARLDDQDTSYSFVVWGYNRAGCTASDVVSATPRPSPGAMGQVLGEMRWIDDARDYVVTSIGPVADRYEVRPVDANDTPATATRFSLGSAPRAAWGGAFGSAIRFQLRACSVWGEYSACGPWSATITAAEPSIDYRPVGLRFDNGRWTWTADPADRGAAVQYACGVTGDDTARGTVSANGCALNRSVQSSWLDVTIGGLTHRFSR